MPCESIPRAAFAGHLLLQQDEQNGSCCSHQHHSCQEQPQLRGSFLLPAQSDLQLGSTMGAQGSQQIPVSSLEPLPSGCRGIPTRFGPPCPDSGCGAGDTDRAPASSRAGWIQCCLLWFTLGFLPWQGSAAWLGGSGGS